jgi:hypothetical protein
VTGARWDEAESVTQTNKKPESQLFQNEREQKQDCTDKPGFMTHYQTGRSWTVFQIVLFSIPQSRRTS